MSKEKSVLTKRRLVSLGVAATAATVFKGTIEFIWNSWKIPVDAAGWDVRSRTLQKRLDFLDAKFKVFGLSHNENIEVVKLRIEISNAKQKRDELLVQSKKSK